MRLCLIARLLPLSVALVSILASAALAQNAPPDLSGSWVLNTSKSTLPKGSAIKSRTLLIENKKTAIVFHYTSDGEKSTETYTPDGQNRVAEDLDSSELMAKASWQRSTLVVEFTLQMKILNVSVNVSGLKPIVAKWSLSADGRTLIDDAADGKQILVYDKQ